jgi:sRNA-binding protein
MTIPADARRPLAGRKITITDLKLKTPPAPLEPVKTAVKPEAEMPRSERVQATLKIFQQRWPALFDRSLVLPLEIGIDDCIGAVLAGTVSKSHLRDALKHWTSRDGYLLALTRSGAMRVSLAGQLVADVTEKEREHARGRLAGRYRRRQLQRQAGA